MAPISRRGKQKSSIALAVHACAIIIYPVELAHHFSYLDDSDEETSSASSTDAPAPIPRRSKFDDEEDDSDVRTIHLLDISMGPC